MTLPLSLTGRELIIFNDYTEALSPPATTNLPESLEIVPDLEYVPQPDTDAAIFRKELIQFKANCDSKPALEFLNSIEDLINQKEKIDVENQKLKSMALKHSEALFADMAVQLLSQIRRCPALEKELNSALDQKEHIALKELVSKLSEALEDNWVDIDTSAESHNVICIEQSELRDLSEQINLLTEIANGSNHQQTVLLKCKEFQQQIHPKRAGWGKKVLTGVLCSGWVLGQVASFALRLCLGLTPSIIALLPSIFPAVWLELLSLLMKVLYKKMPTLPSI